MNDEKGPSPTNVYILKSTRGFVVRPAVAAVSRKGRLRFVNHTRQEVVVFLPSLYGRGLHTVLAGKDTTLDVPEGAPYGPHTYAAYSEEARDFCLGESSPIIIIDE